MYTLKNLTVLLLDLEKKIFEIYIVLAHGGPRILQYLNNFESPTPKDDSCQVSVKSNLTFSRRRYVKSLRTTHDGREWTAIELYCQST